MTKIDKPPLAGQTAAPTMDVVSDKDPRDRGGPAQPMFLVKNLVKNFPVRGGLLNRQTAQVQAVSNVSFQVLKGETLGVVGESGCGKSTLARLLMHLLDSTSGELIFDGDAVGVPGGMPMRNFRKAAQMVFQDSYSSLNPRLPVEDSVSYGPKVHGMDGKEARELAREILEKVGLRPDVFGPRYPHELSGGQKQRVNIARALALSPRLVILDEAVSALDKSVEAQVLNLLRSLKRHFNLTYVFISHDLNVVQYISDRVLVMYLGEVVELGPVDEIYNRPRHPYTRALLRSRLSMDPDDRMDDAPITGDPPNPINPPSGCRFRTRCPYAEKTCAAVAPVLSQWTGRDSHTVACHMYNPIDGHSRSGNPPPPDEFISTETAPHQSRVHA